MLQVRAATPMAQGFMNTAEIVVRDAQRDCRNVGIKFLREAIGKTNENVIGFGFDQDGHQLSFDYDSKSDPGNRLMRKAAN
jgi:hypothetical protein